MAFKKVLPLIAIHLGLAGAFCELSTASAQVPPAVAQERVRFAIRRVLGGAQTSAKSMQAMLADAKGYIARVLPGGLAIFPPTLDQFTASANDAGASLWRAKAAKCGELAVNAGEDVPALLRRASACLAESVGGASDEAGINQIRYVVRQLVNVAHKGAALLRASVPFLPRLMPAGIPGPELMGSALQQALLSASELTARAFAQQALMCSSLPLVKGQSTLDFARRVGVCMSGVAAKTNRESVDGVMNRSLDRLIDTAQKGVSSLRGGMEAALKALDDRIDPKVFYPDDFRALLADATPLLASTFIRGARRCRMMARGPNQDVAAFAQQMGVCLTDGVAEASPLSLVALTLKAVTTVAAAAGQGGDALRQGLVKADKSLRGKVSPGEVFGGEVRRRIAQGDPQWVAQFAKLAPTCQVREFKKTHRFDEFVIRVNLCVYSAATGLTAETLQARILNSMRNVSSEGYKGALALRTFLGKEILELDKLMRVADLYPDAFRVGMAELADSSARGFAPLGVKCSDTKRGGEEALGQYVKRLAACLEDARVQSGGDVLARRVREAVGALVSAASTSAGVFRNAIGPAITLLGGQVPPEQLFPVTLQQAIGVATDEMAAAFVKSAGKCVELQRAAGAPFLPYVESVARCLTGTTTTVLDQARQDAIRDGIAQLATLADGGPEGLLRGYPELWGKVRNTIPLASTLVQGLTFQERTVEFAKRLRATCATMPAATPFDAGNVKACVSSAIASAMAIQPPDACRAKTAMTLLECCLQGQNRLLGSCADHRYACRTGETWQGNACAVPPPPAAVATAKKCGVGQMASSTGVCVYIPCQPGEARAPSGQCKMPTLCPPGATADDATGRCMIAACPPGTQLDAFNRCLSGACALGKVQVAYGVCQPAQCAGSLDAFGRCLSAVPPLGQPGMALPGLVQPGFVQPGFAQPGFAQPGFAQPGFAQPAFDPNAAAAQGAGGCATGTVLGVDGRCMRTFCPPGTVANSLGECTQGSCPAGYAMTIAGQCGQMQ